MTRTTRKTAHEEGEQETVSFDEIIQEVAPSALRTYLDNAFLGVRVYLDRVEARIDALKEEVHGPHYTTTLSDAERPRVTRRRSLDDMQFALRRLMQPEPRPADDDSPQVLQDAINEVIALRQITSDLMQASMNVYQHGLTSIRAMTEK